MPAHRILVVDDDEQIRFLLFHRLEAKDFEVDCASSGEGALELAQSRRYDAAILDFQMPEMDGVALHRTLAGLAPELAERCIFISGSADPGISTYLEGRHRFIAKPFSAGELYAAIDGILAKPRAQRPTVLVGGADGT